MIFVLTLLAAVAAPLPAPAPAPVPVPLGHMAGVAQAEGFDLNAMASGGGVGGFDANAASGGGDAAAFDAAVHQTGWERAITAETIAKARPWGASPLRRSGASGAAEGYPSGGRQGGCGCHEGVAVRPDGGKEHRVRERAR